MGFGFGASRLLRRNRFALGIAEAASSGRSLRVPSSPYMVLALLLRRGLLGRLSVAPPLVELLLLGGELLQVLREQAVIRR